MLIARRSLLLGAIAVERGNNLHLAGMVQRAPQNVQRTLQRLSAAGIVRLHRGEGRMVRPTVAARKLHIEIDLGVEG